MNFFTITGLGIWFLITFAAGALVAWTWLAIAVRITDGLLVRLKRPVRLTVPSNGNVHVEYIYPQSYSLIGIRKWCLVLAVNLHGRHEVRRDSQEGGQ
jgi:hypothetical protein